MKNFVNLPLKNVYRIVGDDYYLIDLAVDQLKQACGISLSDLNQSFFDDENFLAEDVIDACNQMPFMAEKRLIILKDLSKISETDKQKIIKYSKNPSPYSVLVVIDNNKNFTALESALIDCKTFSYNELDKLVQEKVKEENFKIDDEAIKILIENCSNNLSKINMELKKLFSYCLDKTITKEDVENLVCKSDDYTIFELSDALSKKQDNRAVKLLELMLANMEPTMILSLLAGHFRRLFHAKISSLSNVELANFLGVKEFAITKAKQQASNFTAIALKKIIELILNVDYMIKSGQMSAENAIHYLIFSIMEMK